ncbi:hypothetical protein I6F36_36550 [Bradyrhizobium sp. BRP19]|uniref:LuxR C-terminal-related transcriptional regulator n=1 Tax=Bradyrhizobium sp. BRP19 TaxID=2793823 RepID=UPI001CD1FAA8|nr:hypothetical protein [Bradyrhizobium sp. BRP19]
MKQLILSPREKQFLRRIAAGKTDREIAARLGGTRQQIAQQRARLLERLGVSSEAEIAAAARRLAEWAQYRGVT